MTTENDYDVFDDMFDMEKITAAIGNVVGCLKGLNRIESFHVIRSVYVAHKALLTDDLLAIANKADAGYEELVGESD